MKRKLRKGMEIFIEIKIFLVQLSTLTLDFSHQSLIGHCKKSSKKIRNRQGKNVMQNSLIALLAPHKNKNYRKIKDTRGDGNYNVSNYYNMNHLKNLIKIKF
jgi:hypothetical protein